MSSRETTPRTGGSLADDILGRVDELIQDSLRNSKPLEVDPYRQRLFELFVTADGAGYLSPEAGQDLTADTLCKRLAARWGLDAVAQESVARQERIPAANVSQMRALWSVLRMWMEWTYAWQRWQEFHEGRDEPR
jgi:hypothetical protein